MNPASQTLAITDGAVTANFTPPLCFEGDWFDAPRRYSPIRTEIVWRRPPDLAETAALPADIVATRWTDTDAGTREARAEIRADYHTIGLALAPTTLALSVSGRTIHDGHVAPGMLQVAGPAQPFRAIFRAPCDFLHLHVANGFLRQCAEDAGAVALADPCFVRDTTIMQLGQALLAAGSQGGPMGRLYVDGIGQAIVARLLALSATPEPPEARPKVSPLPKWRLRRVIDYIEAHLADTVALADLAQASGLTRMHFAAQFRVATGQRPHEYLLRRRVERAQQLLATSMLPLVEVALGVGFQTQAHFSSVFKRFAGDTPARWRHVNARPA